MNDDVLDRLRTICGALPEAAEVDGSVGSPVYKVRDKIFVMRHPHEGRSSLWCKAPPGFQQTIVEAEPERFFVPPYVGHNGWIGIWLDVDMDWGFVADLIEDSYRMTAPKRLIKLLDAQNPQS